MKIFLDKAFSFMYNRRMEKEKGFKTVHKISGSGLPSSDLDLLQKVLPDFIPFQNLNEEFLLAIELDDYRDFKQAANYVTEPVLDNVSTAITDSKTRKHTRGSNAIIGSESK